ncbi:MAG TPA: ATP-binding protein [Allosphingosinicella sp.]|nr:ATP-binding protein [Allosphingosinicella sp.]
MGEKLLAQRLIRLLRETESRSGRIARALVEWAFDEQDWLWPGVEFPEDDEGRKGLWDRLPALADAIDTQESPSAVLRAVEVLSDLLAFAPFDREVLGVATGLCHFQHLSALRSRFYGCGEDLLRIVGRLAGAEAGGAARRVRRSEPVTLGLLCAGGNDGHGSREISIDWNFNRLLDAGLTEPDEMIEMLVGAPQQASLTAADFAEQAAPVALLVRLLRGALRRRAAGVNVLIYGPPGTGKTELARVLAAACEAPLYAVGEQDEYGEEPDRSIRIAALKRSQRLLQQRGGAVLLFDEMEDLFRDPGGRRPPSKIFINRLLEGNQVPTIWTSNVIDSVDPAHLRRMSYILRLGYPGAKARARILARVAESEGVAPEGSGLAGVLPQGAGTAGVARAALRAAALADGGAEEARAVGNALILGLRGGRALPPEPSGAVDFDLYEADLPVGPMLERIAAPGAPEDLSLLLTGPPGTGKTALAAALAERLDRPLLVKRASDLLSKWVGGTEAQIADAFAEAREKGALLLFDEADSLLADRAGAVRNWEISQVNELLTWMDSHPLPFVAATNFARRLDPAALRRFVFKIELMALSPPLAARAWARFFGGEAPVGLARVAGLTPGDFAVVARQLRYRAEASAAEILDLLEAEVRVKPEQSAPIGF